MISKFTLAQQQLQNFITFFRCPLCHESFHLSADQKSLNCTNNHSFDIAKKGYVNFHPHGQDIFYNAALFKARNFLFTQRFFEPITNTLYSLLEAHQLHTVLDAGCGDGSHLNELASLLPQNLFFGVDLSRQAIQLATDHFKPNILWSVGDIANLPYAGGRFDAIVNILSPANYPTFKRCLKKNGVLIKVMPGDSYLDQLRRLLNKEVNPKEGQKVFNWMEKNAHIVEHIHFKDAFPLSVEEYQALLQMTPLVATLPKEDTAFLALNPLTQITRHWQIVLASFE